MNRIGTTAEFAAIYAQAKGLKYTEYNENDGYDKERVEGDEQFVQQCSIDKRSNKIAAFKYRRRNGLTGRYNQVLKCPVCFAEFRKLSNIRDHERMHSGKRPFRCRRCALGFAQERNRNRHEAQHVCTKLADRNNGKFFAIVNVSKTIQLEVIQEKYHDNCNQNYQPLDFLKTDCQSDQVEEDCEDKEIDWEDV